MERDEIISFLEAIDAELVEPRRGGETLDLYLIGRSALVLRYELNLATKDVDIVRLPRLRAGAQGRRALSARGRGTRSAWASTSSRCPRACRRFPAGYCRRSEDIPGPWRVLRPKQPEPHDLAVTKLKRFHAKDRQDLQILCDSGQLDVDRLRQGLESAFAWAEKDDPDREIAARNLLRVIDYLEGKARTL